MTSAEYLRTGRPDIEAVVETLCLAFESDPVLTWNFPRDLANRSALVAGFFRVTTQLILDHGGEIGATANYEGLGVWSPPGATALSEAETDDFLNALFTACGEGGERAAIIMQALDEALPADLPAHYHVMFAAVRPGAQAQGHAHAISNLLARAANEAGAGVYAEASNLRSLALWERMGLRRIGPEITLPDGGPSLFPIWGDAGTWSLSPTPRPRAAPA
ncbi:N-acetyltransferase [Pseudofrankia inefficax]|uniref:GCN5-related N-acetyltransferase n=1 Tax=Pseudofrankia inefficax (strain DSM 45817 / CECT 9037 / DDB 130130 / EuI1c) TaxID=298654 RepID=E3JDF3_PSEI1|nr:N-acetyltransferase [Pseudofrankia inefficax]ADP83586.1 GCN5-related N-acetyltransferase [Pseudofrankia inefficax]